jgi:hypothetical protein
MAEKIVSTDKTEEENKKTDNINSDNSFFGVRDDSINKWLKTVQLQPFDIDKVAPGSTHVFFGRRRSGKSECMRILLNRMRKMYDYVWVMSCTAFNGFWTQQVPKYHFVHQGYSSELLGQILDFARRENPDRTKYPNAKFKYRVLVILDDVISTDPRDPNAQNVRFCPHLSTLFAMGRHYGVDCWVATQLETGVTRLMRLNTDYAWIFKQYSLSAKENVVCDYLSMVPKHYGYKLLSEYTGVDEKTGERDIIVVDAVAQTDILEKSVFAFHCAAEKPQKWGKREYWVHSAKVQKQVDEEEERKRNGGLTDQEMLIWGDESREVLAGNSLFQLLKAGGTPNIFEYATRGGYTSL